jgi:EAL domain-containing protein (putative c-di-GMP-specific phosphodiesterase class I)/CheY-like chemotaxis protein
LSAALETKPSVVRVLVVDDDSDVRQAVGLALTASGYDTCCAASGRDAADLVRGVAFDAVITDIRMPDMNGIELLRALRYNDEELPVILMTGCPEVATAAEAVALRAFAYLEKPFELGELQKVVRNAVNAGAMARVKKQALLLAREGRLEDAERLELEENFRRALLTLWMAYQPIVRAVDQNLFGYEALLRSTEKALPDPEAMLHAAEKLGRLPKLAHRVWAATAASFVGAEEHALLFVNLHAADLSDPMLSAPSSPLVGMADRVVLEITERASLDKVEGSHEKLVELRRIGFRIAIDDLGAGYAGLTSFAAIEPQFAKLDASIVRGVHKSRTKQKIIGSLISLCNELSIIVVAEGVETMGERDALVDLGCDLLQGYLFAIPGKPFPAFTW